MQKLIRESYYSWGTGYFLQLLKSIIEIFGIRNSVIFSFLSGENNFKLRQNDV